MVTTTYARPLPDAIAPRWHTAALVALIVAVALTGTFAHVSAAPAARISAVYVPAILVQGALVFWVSRAFRPRSVLRELVGRASIADVAIALALAAIVIGSELVFGSSSGPGAPILPRTGPERAVWLAVAASVGFAEELVYRGYFIVQFRAFTRSSTVAIVLSALIFAIAHANQGALAMLRFTVYAILFGAVAVQRRSLVPTILCHIGIDMIGAFH
jgi:membrane protease YdiL (CAAX protease family)